MADTTFVATDRFPGRPAVSLMGRIRSLFGLIPADLGNAVDEARRELKMHQAMRGFHRWQLRDLGLDRGAC